MTDARNAGKCVHHTREEYRRKHLRCQYTEAVEGNVYFRRRHPRGTGLELDHIWGKRGPRAAVEHPSNYAMACPDAHDRKTGVVGDIRSLGVSLRIVIACFKLELALATDDWDHFDRGVIRQVFGKDIGGWIEMQLSDGGFEDWVVERGEFVVDYCEAEGARE